MGEKIIAFGPASVANVGPFYDSMGFCLGHLGDFVIAEKNPSHCEVALLEDVQGKYGWQLAKDEVKPETNCALQAAQCLFEKIDKRKRFGIDLTLIKNMPTKSGLGSSAASCVASVKAVMALMGITPKELGEDLVKDALIWGERTITNHTYPDNVVPSFFGGFHITSELWHQRVRTPDFYSVIFMDGAASTPEQRVKVDNHFKEILESRSNREQNVRNILGYIRTQASYGARTVHALLEGDLATFGKCMSLSASNFLEESRGGGIEKYYAKKRFLMEQGALGCTISGSGPSIVCVVPDEKSALNLRDKFIACGDFKPKNGDKLQWLISRINTKGSEIVDDLDEWIGRNSSYHNFWSD